MKQNGKAHVVPRRSGFALEAALLVFILCVALGVRVYEIDYGFDGDEVFSVNLAARSFSQFLSGALQDTPHPPLYYLLLHLWVKILGSSEAAVRSLSILFSALFMAVMYGLLRRLIGFRMALALMALLSFSPVFVYYGQQARPYALIALLSAASLYAFTEVLQHPRDRARAVLWAVSCGLLLYTQYLAFLWIAVQAGLVFRYLRPERSRILLYAAAGCSAVVPWVLLAMGGPFLSGHDPVSRIAWIRPPSVSDFMWLYLSVFGENSWLQARWLLLALALLFLTYLIKRGVDRRMPAEHVLIFSMGIGLPLAVFALSVLGPKPVFAQRQLVGAVIAFTAALGVCLQSVPKWIGALSMAVLTLWTLQSLPQGLPHYQKPPWREIAALIDARHGGQDVAVQENWVRDPLEFYRRTGQIRTVDDMKTGRDGFLYACRPGPGCTLAETGAPPQHRSLLAVWKWGAPQASERKLFLYKIKPARSSGDPEVAGGG